MSVPFRAAILMYHAVGLPVRSPQDRKLNVSEESFDRQMRMLLALGWRARMLADIIDAVSHGLSLPTRTFAVSFDDAYRCVGEAAAPTLRRLQMPATLFVVSHWSGTQESIGFANGRLPTPVMQWDELADLQRAGWEIGGHTATHPHLDLLDDEAAYREIADGREAIAARLGVEPRSFCYPFGHLNRQTPELARRAGYAGACTVRSGLVSSRSDVLALPRVKIGYSDGVIGLLYRILARPALPTFRRRRRSHGD